MTSIKPCPFCGSEAKFESLVTMSVVQCTNRKCRAKIYSTVDLPYGQDFGLAKQIEDAEALERWNRRVNE